MARTVHPRTTRCTEAAGRAVFEIIDLLAEAPLPPSLSRMIGRREMKSIQAVLIVNGESPKVLELADGKLDGRVRQRSPVGSAIQNGQALKENFVIVEIPLRLDDDDSALAAIEEWLSRNRTALTECEAQKTLELYSYLESDVGSRTLTISNSLIRIAAGLNLNIANQAIRMLTEDEYRNRKR